MTESTAQLIRSLGYLMLAVAAVILAAMLVTLFQIFFSPDSIAAVGIVGVFLAAQVPLFMADIRGEKSTFNVDPAARMIIAIFVGAVVVIALSSVLRALISLGLTLVRIEPPGQGPSNN